MRVVMGIDPGTANLGFGVIRVEAGRMVALDGGVIETPASERIENRLARIHEAIAELVAWHRPTAIAIEDLYFNQNVSSALKVGQASGVSMLAAAQAGVECFAYTPQAIKRSICGSGSAGKKQVQKMVGMRLGLAEAPQPDHAGDALAVAICHGGTVAHRDAVAAADGPLRVAS